MKHLHPCRTLHWQLHLACSQLLELVETYLSMWCWLHVSTCLYVWGSTLKDTVPQLVKQNPNGGCSLYLKGLVYPEFKFHPFTSHHNVIWGSWWHFLPHVTVLEFHGRKGFQPMEVWCGQGLCKMCNMETCFSYILQVVSSKCWQSNLTRSDDVNITFLSKISTVTMTRFHVALASMASGCFGNKHGVNVAIVAVILSLCKTQEQLCWLKKCHQSLN